MPPWPCHNHPVNYNLSWIFTKSRLGQCFIIIENLHNAILCKYKDKEKSEKNTRLSTSYRENQDKYIYLAILLLDLSNIAIHGKNPLNIRYAWVMKYRQTYTIFNGFGSRWCDGFDRRSPTAELLNKVNISILISNYQTQAPVLKNISFCNKIITGTIMIERFVTVAILIFFRPAHDHLSRFSGCNSCIFRRYR